MRMPDHHHAEAVVEVDVLVAVTSQTRLPWLASTNTGWGRRLERKTGRLAEVIRSIPQE